jgi:mRNA interferase MazF
MKRGEVWWARLPPPSGRRPVILVSRGAAHAPVRTRVIVVEASRTIRSIPSEVLLTKRDGLPERCVANADNVATIPKAWLETRIASLPDRRIIELDQALRFAMQLDS